MNSLTIYICPECSKETGERKCPDDGTPTVRRDLVKSPGAGDPLLGTILDGKFFVEERIGRGGMAVVYRARHLKTDAPMALKVLSSLLVEDLTAVRRFYKEARLAATLLHPNTVRVFDFGSTEAGSCYMAMEYLQGRTLGQAFSRERPLEEARLAHISAQALRSLGEAHEKSLVHRDLKPDNIFLIDHYGEPDFVKVLDFGIAKAMIDNRESLTETGSLMGTPKYMSPEQSQGENLDGRSDLYSLGVIMYEMLSGSPPFEHEQAVNLLMSHVHDPPVPIHEHRPNAEQGICDLIMALLEKKPSDRPENAAAVLQRLLELKLPTWKGLAVEAAPSAIPTIRVESPKPREGISLLHTPARSTADVDSHTPTRQVRGTKADQRARDDDDFSDAPTDPEAPQAAETGEQISMAGGGPVNEQPTSQSLEFLNPATIDDSVVVIVTQSTTAPSGLKSFMTSRTGKIWTILAAVVLGAGAAYAIQFISTYFVQFQNHP